MRITLRHTVTLALAICWMSCCAQQQWIYTLNQFNPYESFSALAGSYGEIGISARHRQQWMGVEGAPVSSQVAVHGPWNNLGWGLQLRSERTGARTMTMVRITGAYRIALKSTELSFALNAGLIRYQLHTDQLNIRDGDDVAFLSGNPRASVPSLDFSTAFRSEHFLLALQANSLNNPEFDWYPNSGGKQRLEVEALGACSIRLNETLELRPSISVRYTANAPLSGDALALLRWNEELWIGGGYRSGEIILGVIQWQITDVVRLGYSLDAATLHQLSRPLSHELFLGINMASSDRTGPSMRHF